MQHKECHWWVERFMRKFLTNFLGRGRSNHRRCSVRKGVLRNFTKFTGKHLYQSLFFNKVAGLRHLFQNRGNIFKLLQIFLTRISHYNLKPTIRKPFNWDLIVYSIIYQLNKTFIKIKTWIL